MEQTIIQRGAEAVISLNGEDILKTRVKKGYRLSALDEKIRKSRTKREAKLLEGARKLICVPTVRKVDERSKEIIMEFIKGKKLSDFLSVIENWKEVCFQIGENLAKLHDAGIIHGDLTTSNMIWVSGRLYFIDFGLGFISEKVEDKAVDLHLIKEALEARHYEHYEKFFSEFLEGYKNSKNFGAVMNRFKRVELRGRYKNQY